MRDRRVLSGQSAAVSMTRRYGLQGREPAGKDADGTLLGCYRGREDNPIQNVIRLSTRVVDAMDLGSSWIVFTAHAVGPIAYGVHNGVYLGST